MKRNLLNILMLLLFLLTMSFHVFPMLLHEILGTAWLFVIIFHLVLNRAWFTSLGKGRLTAYRFFSGITNLLLTASAITVILTGVFISNHLFKGWFGLELARNITVHQLHTSVAYLLLVLLGIHLGLHWQGLWYRFLHWLSLDKNSPRVRCISYCSLVIIFATGVYGSFLNRLGDRLLMKHIFATEATGLYGGIFILLMLGIMGLYAIAGYLIQKISVKR